MSEKSEESLSRMPKIVYHPKKFQESQIEKFRKFVEKKYVLKFDDYWKLHEWSWKNFPEFWSCVWDFFNVRHSKNFTEVFDKKNSFENMKWFKGARLNYAENVLKYSDEHIAIIATDKDDDSEYFTYLELQKEVQVYAQALKETGIRRGDLVACYMSNKKEAVFAFLATASIGAIWSGALPLLGAKAALSRFLQLAPKVLFTAGNFLFEGTEVNTMQKIPIVVSGLPSLEKVVFIPSKTESVVEDISNISKCETISEFLKGARNKLRDSSLQMSFEQVSFDYPLCISFTSGSTGAPKGLIHSHGSFLATLKDLGLHQNITRNDVLLNFSPVGWISWNIFANSLHLGSTLCLYDGYPFDEHPTRFWDLVDKHKLTTLFIWSSTIEDWEKMNQLPTEKHSLESLKQILPTGSILKPQSYEFLTEKIKKNLFCCPAYGTTEIFSFISGGDINRPIHKGEIQGPSLGMEINILNEEGNPICNQKGDLVISTPYPGCCTSILNDVDNEMLKQLYLSEHPGHWNVSDIAWRNSLTNGLIVCGRSDETMNPKGARFSCAEIYFALDGFPNVLDSVCVSQYNHDCDERVILFVKMRPGSCLTPEVEKSIRQTILDTLTVEHVPDIIIETPDIPYSMTGKKLNVLVKNLINKKAIKNVDLVMNPSCVEFFRNVKLEKF